MPKKTDSKPKNSELEAAELRKAKAEAEKAELDAKAAAVDLEKNQIALDRLRAMYDEEDREEADRRIEFSYSVGAQTVGHAIAKIKGWMLHAPGCEISIVLNSPGGSVFDGLALGDVMEQASRAGHKITATVNGYAASMAGVILQFADHRVIGRNSYLHLHEVSAGAIGKASEVMDEALLMKKLTQQAAEIYARRSHLTAEEIFDMMDRREVWLSAAEALSLGFVDEIR